MEVVQAQRLSTFDLQSKPPFPYPLGDMSISSSNLHSLDSRSSEVSESESPASGDRELPPFDVAGSLTGDHAPAKETIESSAAAVKVQKTYRGYRTRRRLADSAVVAEELWWLALDFARLNHSTISFFNFSKPETATSRWNRISLNASRVGKGLSKDAKAQKLAFQHWIEAIDPRHRYGHSLHKYYEEWCKTDAGQPFFYWLDLGDGKELDLKECPRSKLKQQCIKYLGPVSASLNQIYHRSKLKPRARSFHRLEPKLSLCEKTLSCERKHCSKKQEREHYEYLVEDGKIIHKQTRDLLDTKKRSQGAKWIFVMSTFKKLYAGEKKKGTFHHSSFLAGGATLAAGRLEAENGTLKSISAYSGHYRPSDDRLDSFLSFLKENGVKLNEVEIRKANEDYDSYDDSKFNRAATSLKSLANSELPKLETHVEQQKTSSSETTELPQTGIKTNYKRTLSGGLQSPRAEVPKNKILERINSKKAAKSYQLGNQLSLKWSTGAGPRIGCVADYPVEVRMQALEFVNLSPRTPPTPFSFRRLAGPASPTSHSTADPNNGDGTSAD